MVGLELYQMGNKTTIFGYSIRNIYIYLFYFVVILAINTSDIFNSIKAYYTYMISDGPINSARIIQYNHTIKIPWIHETHISRVSVYLLDGKKFGNIDASYVDLEAGLHQFSIFATHGYKVLASITSFSINLCEGCIYFFEMKILGVDREFFIDEISLTNDQNEVVGLSQQPKRPRNRLALYKVRIFLYMRGKEGKELIQSKDLFACVPFGFSTCKKHFFKYKKVR